MKAVRTARTAARCLVQCVLMGYLVLVFLLVAPSFFGIGVNAVTSGSMEPLIPTGSVIYSVPVTFDEICEGDIIVFTLEGSDVKVTHRVVEMDEELELLTTKGDANEEADARSVSMEQVQGKVMCTAARLGWLAILLTEWTGKMSLLAILAGLAALEELLAFCPGRRRYKKEGING